MKERTADRLGAPNLGIAREKGLQPAKLLPTGGFYLLSTGRHPKAFDMTPLDGSFALRISLLCLHFRITHCPSRDNRTSSSQILGIVGANQSLNEKKKSIRFDERTNVNTGIQ